MDAEVAKRALAGLSGESRRVALRTLAHGLSKGERRVLATLIFGLTRAHAEQVLRERHSALGQLNLEAILVAARDRWALVGLDVCASCLGARPSKLVDGTPRAYVCPAGRCVKTWRYLLDTHWQRARRPGPALLQGEVDTHG